MRTSVLVVAFLALACTRASAETGVVNGAPKITLGSSRNDKTKPQGLPAPAAKASPLQLPPQPDSDAGLSDSAPERETGAIFQPSTPVPFMKYVGPIVGGVVGAGALAGVIAISVMKKPKTNQPAQVAPAPAGTAGAPAPAPPAQTLRTTLETAVQAQQITVQVADGSQFASGDTIKIGSEYNMVGDGYTAPTGQATLPLDHPMNTNQPPGATVTIVHDVRPKATIPPATPAPMVAQMSARAAAPGASTNTTGGAENLSSGSTKSTVVTVALVLVGVGLLSVCVVAVLYFLFGRKKRGRKTQPRRETPFVADYPEDQEPMMGTQMDVQPTMDLCESQYMQVNMPPLNPQGLGSIPTMQNVVPMQTMPPPPPPPMAMSYAPQPSAYYAPQQSAYSAGPMSMYQQASPLANTVSAMPTTAFNMGAMPTMQLQGVPQTIYN